MRIVSITTAAILASALGLAVNVAAANPYDDKEPKGVLECKKEYGKIKCKVCKFFPDKDKYYPVYTTYDFDLHTEGNKHFKCDFDIKAPEKTIVLRDFKCLIKIKKDDYDYVQYADQSHWVANKAGKGILTCHFKKDDKNW